MGYTFVSTLFHSFKQKSVSEKSYFLHDKMLKSKLYDPYLKAHGMLVSKSFFLCTMEAELGLPFKVCVPKIGPI